MPSGFGGRGGVVVVVVVGFFCFFLDSIMGQMLNPFMSKAKFYLNETRMHEYVLNRIFFKCMPLEVTEEKTCS